MRYVVAGALLLAGAAGAVPAAQQQQARPASMGLAALNQLEAGMWQLEVQGRPARTFCLSDPLDLVEIEHDQPNCSRFVIADQPRSSTVQYSCQKAGWGRTTIRVDTPRFATIRTQGISRNAPFDYAVTARRVGGCTQVAAKPR